MRRRQFTAIISPLLLLALATLFGVASPARAIICIICPPPPIFLIEVNSTSDLTNPGDGKCSLRAAISASNINGVAGNCSATGRQTGETAAIVFNIGAGNPTINVGSALPTISNKLSINGNTGGATRVELLGPGTGDGLSITGAGAAGTSIRNLVISGLGGLNTVAVSVSSTSNIIIAGNYIGTNADGTPTAIFSGAGIKMTSASAQIGGLNGLTPGGPCTGDCNLISGNDQYGIDSNSSSGVIEGNFIGTDVTGMSAIGNGDGIRLEGSSPTIGGTAAGAGNLISGNMYGINVQKATPVVQGNLIGTNISGTGAIPNTVDGVLVNQGNQNYPFSQNYAFMIGGAAAGERNVVSGNTGAGIELFFADRVTIQGNFIGTQLNGTSALPNGNAGVLLYSSTHANVMGGTDPGQGNIIAFNGSAGVIVGLNNYADEYFNEIRGNSIHDNTGKGISLLGNANNSIVPPVITGVNPVTGTACAGCSVDVFSDAADEGKVYEGTVAADGTTGAWSFSSPMSGPNVTATNTDSSHDTSEFSAPMALPATPTPTPSPSPTPTPTASATPTNTATPTPTHTASPTPTPTATPTSHPSPTVPSCGSPQYRGDADGNGHVDIHDVLATLSALAGVPPGAACAALAEVDCDNELAADDALLILDFVAGTPLPQPTNCAGVGTLT